ncbi:hypothetical protein ACHWQZ_G014007 [Mnemiopsis leidyi]
MQNFTSLPPTLRKRPNSDSDDSSSAPPCKRFQTSLNLAQPHTTSLNLTSRSTSQMSGAHPTNQTAPSEYSQINEVLKKAHFYSRAMRANFSRTM